MALNNPNEKEQNRDKSKGIQAELDQETVRTQRKPRTKLLTHAKLNSLIRRHGSPSETRTRIRDGGGWLTQLSSSTALTPMNAATWAAQFLLRGSCSIRYGEDIRDLPNLLNEGIDCLDSIANSPFDPITQNLRVSFKRHTIKLH
ncbi:unnamed protein product [Prunus armeniaca]